MARMRKSDGRFRRTTFADLGHQACPKCRRFYPTPPLERDENGFVSPTPKPAPCPHCGHDPKADP